MKKILSLLLVALTIFSTMLVFGSCGNNGDTNGGETQKTNVKISVLNGTTGFGAAKLMEDDANGASANDYEFKVETDATNIISALMAGSIDMAALPTNAAANVYNKTGGKVQVLAINTLGVLYLIEKDDQISSINDLNGKTIYVPAQNPTFITKHILDSNGIDATIDSTTYSTPAALQAAVVAGQVDLAVLPQPVVTAAIAGAKKANNNYSVALDLTAEWDKIPNSEKLVQGCIVVRKDFAEKNKGAVEWFLNEYEASINYLNENPKDAAALIVKYGIFANATVAENAIPKCNVVFMKGEEMKSAMQAFISVMFEIAPKSVGDKLPLDDFYLVNP